MTQNQPWSSSNRSSASLSGNSAFRRLGPLDAEANERLIATFLGRYGSEITRKNYRQELRYLLHVACADTPAALVTEAQIVAWATRPAANNTIRSRIALARTFYRWCLTNDHCDHDPTFDLVHLNKSYPRTYGKVQSKHPARFLTTAEAKQLLAACETGTDIGARDAIVIGLGLCGVRSTEILTMTWANVGPGDRMAWTGKGNRPRRITLSPTLRARLIAWQERWSEPTAEAPGRTDTIVRAKNPGGGKGRTRSPRIDWTRPITSRNRIFDIVRTRGDLAGLGHVTPHDLRRTAAAILHRATDANGAHLFDLLDIQQVLGHTDPATTMRSYLQPISTETLDRAASALDL